MHVKYTGGIDYNDELYLSVINDLTQSFMDEILNNNVVTKRVHVKVCRKCGKMELYVDFNSSEVL